MLLHTPYYWDDNGWTAGTSSDSLRWYVFDDRQMYRPGEEVHIKGWLRRLGGRQNGDVGLVGGEVTSVSYQLTDPQGNSIGSGQADVNALGGFDFAFTIPQTVNLGTASLEFECPGQPGRAGWHFLWPFHSRSRNSAGPNSRSRPAIETTGPYFAGGSAVLAVEAKYYAGGALPNADVTWEVRTSPGQLFPAQLARFRLWRMAPLVGLSLRLSRPGWRDTKPRPSPARRMPPAQHLLRLDFNQSGQPDQNPQPISIVAQATVMDVNRQAWSSTTSLLVHPADLYVGLRSERYFVEKGTPLKVDFIVTDLDGNPVSGRPVVVTRRTPGMEIPRRQLERRGSGYPEVPEDLRTRNRIPAPSRLPSAAATASPRSSPMNRDARTRPASPAGSAAGSCRPPARWNRKRSR